MELISLKGVSLKSKIMLLNKLGYGSDGDFIIDSKGNKVIDKYIDIPVKIENMIIFPGSEIILDDNELSISSFFEEFGDVF